MDICSENLSYTLEEKNNNKVSITYKTLCEISDLGHQILLPSLINIAKQNNQLSLVSEVIKEICNWRPDIKEYLALLAIMDLNINEKIIIQSFYEFLSNEIYFSELLHFNKMESISELVSKDLVNNIRVKLNHNSINKFKYLCKNCGYKTIRLSWQCPTCRSWELSAPINFITNN